MFQSLALGRSNSVSIPCYCQCFVHRMRWGLLLGGLSWCEGKIGLQFCELAFGQVIHRALTEVLTRDPFDRIIVSQVTLQNTPVISQDQSILDDYKQGSGSDGPQRLAALKAGTGSQQRTVRIWESKPPIALRKSTSVLETFR